MKPNVPTVKDAVAKFFADCEARQLRPPTIQKQKNLLHKRLRSFFRFCQQAGWIAQNPAHGVKPPKVVQTPTLPFSVSEMKRILAACEEYPERNSFGHNNRAGVNAFVLLLRYSGSRIQDAVTLKRDRIEKGRLFLYTQKTGTPVHVPLPPRAVKALRSIENGSPYFFWSGNGLPKTAVADWQRSLLRRVFNSAKIEDGHAHRFRDTFAVELLLAGVSIETVSVLLRHSDMRITLKHYRPWVKSPQDKLGEPQEAHSRGPGSGCSLCRQKPTRLPSA